MTQKAIKVGDSVAVVIPKKSLKSLGIRAGDEINVEVNQQTKVMSVSSSGKSSQRQQRIGELTFNFLSKVSASFWLLL